MSKKNKNKNKEQENELKIVLVCLGKRYKLFLLQNEMKWTEWMAETEKEGTPSFNLIFFIFFPFCSLKHISMLNENLINTCHLMFRF